MSAWLRDHADGWDPLQERFKERAKAASAAAAQRPVTEAAIPADASPNERSWLTGFNRLHNELTAIKQRSAAQDPAQSRPAVARWLQENKDEIAYVERQGAEVQAERQAASGDSFITPSIHSSASDLERDLRLEEFSLVDSQLTILERDDLDSRAKRDAISNWLAEHEERLLSVLQQLGDLLSAKK